MVDYFLPAFSTPETYGHGEWYDYEYDIIAAADDIFNLINIINYGVRGAA